MRTRQTAVRIFALQRFGLQPIVAVLIVSCLIGIGEPAAAQSRVNKGDEIEVFYRNKWYPAVVIDKDDRGNVLAELDRDGRLEEREFTRDQFRRPCEAGALGSARQWSDASGTFRIEAALLGAEDEVVTLRKLDMTEIDVPMSRLSDADQRYLKRALKEAGLASGGITRPPPVEQFAMQEGIGSAAMAFGGRGGEGRVALTPDPMPSYVKFKQGGTGFPKQNNTDRIGAVLPIGGADGWVLASVESENSGFGTPTRLVWVSLTRQKVEGFQMLPPGETVLDYHPPSHRLLTCAAKSSGGSDDNEKPLLTVWEVLPTDKKASPVVRFDSGAESQRHKAPWARLIDGNTILHGWKKQEFVAWDVAAKAMRYQLNQEAYYAPPPTLSAGHKYLFMPEDKQVTIYEAATGRAVSALPGRASAIALTEDGRRAAVLSTNTVSVWDLTDATAEARVYQAEAIGSLSGGSFNWVGDKRLMAGGRHHNLVLFSLERRIALWNYRFDMNALRGGRDETTRHIIAGHLVYTAGFKNGDQEGLAVGAVSLPGPNVEEMTAGVTRGSLLVLKHGTPVCLKVSAGSYNHQVQQALESKIEENGWTLDPEADIVLTAEMTRGETQRVTYRSFWGRRIEETVTVTPYISAARIEYGEQNVWQSATTTGGAPSSVQLREGETVQGEINKYQKPAPEFFERLKIPAELLDPNRKDGIGTTDVTNRGLIPRPLTPALVPGNSAVSQ